MKDAMTEEYESIMKNDVWDVVPRPQDKTVVTAKWLYKIKHGAGGSAEKYKARFVTRGFSQKEGWNLHQMDVKTASLHGSIKEEVYVEQPKGFEIHDRESHVCRLKKSLYELKQAPQAWYERINSYLMKLGFSRSEANPNLYFKVEDDKPLILVLYVDDLFLIGADPFIHKCKRELASEFEMKDLGLMHYSLGLEVSQKSRGDFPILRKICGEYIGEIRVVDRKSTSGCCFSLGSTSISWMSRTQKSVALSTAEAEYIAASMASYEAVWLRKLFSEMLKQTKFLL
eukprot:PITA_36310